LIRAGLLVDVALAFMALELLLVIIVHRRTGRGPQPLDICASLVAGGALLVALQFALRGQPWPGVAVCLLVSLGGHVWDLWRRWR
jgi:hypothetical protein